MSGLQFCAQEEMKGMKESNQKEFQESEVGKLMKLFVCAFCPVRLDFKNGWFWNCMPFVSVFSFFQSWIVQTSKQHVNLYCTFANILFLVEELTSICLQWHFKNGRVECKTSWASTSIQIIHDCSYLCSKICHFLFSVSNLCVSKSLHETG